ncbi:hypothetical protein [Paenibacillus macquariensis]|uniref:hypothetical protein n=1 Tax=Paenibacillus macquariensis TaxID=948756 RepID=UPI0007C2EEE8|nr:hypothetical protein [Paenibacillus macquariensis]MEC0090007.1 hypothetical protein [Paenibacillus macquariensis]OAB31108.1 hypothetical protein PMSM_20510 [Paenibacillus macquariensis subsp. macquariensis]
MCFTRDYLTITPFAHFDLFYNPEREQRLVTMPVQLDLSEFQHLFNKVLKPSICTTEGSFVNV